MFSPDTPSNGRSLRPKRTRQTAGTEDTLQLPQAKRKRSALRRDTFEPLADASLNEVAGRQAADPKTNGHVDTTKTKPAKSKELTFRGPKADRRSDRTQPTTVLATNDFYTVSELPSLPQQVRDFDRSNKPYSCVFSSEHGYALAISHTEAVIWPYTSSASIPSSRDVVVIPLSFLQTSESDPLPLATFTRSSINTEPGLLVISAKWGNVSYWDTITNASTITPGQQSTGVRGSVPNLGGEVIEDLVNAEPSGFIISFSHGRVAHVSVRDQKGRSAIGVQFLRKPPSASLLGSIGGSVRNFVGWDRRKGTPLVKAGAATRGQRNVVVLTENAELELWDTNVAIGHTLLLHRTMVDDIKTALSGYVPPEKSVQQFDLKVLDFELSWSGKELTRGDEAAVLPMTVLISLSDPLGTYFYLIELTASAEEVDVSVVHPVTCYSTKLSKTETWQPRLSVIKSTAFAIFETAIVLFSLSRIHESPSSQLLGEGHSLPGPFQDVIQLDQEKAYKFLGHTGEENGEDATCLLAVSKKGLLRVQSHKNATEVDAESYIGKITAKSRIEQAIFYGTEKDNPLNLNTPSATSFSQDEIYDAALAISHEIVTSTAKGMAKSNPSTTKHLQDRAKHLDNLIHYLMKYYPHKSSDELRDKLMWDAENVAAAQAIWKVQESIQRRYPLDDREMCYMEFALRALSEQEQNYPDEEKGQTDRIRYWLCNSIDNVKHFLTEIVDCLRELPEFDITDPRVIGELTLECLDLWTAAYAAVFKFREDNAAWYGFDNRVLVDGVFLDGYDVETGRPWTSEPEPNRYAHRLLDEVCAFLAEWWDYKPEHAQSARKKMPKSSGGIVHDAPPRALLNDFATKLPKEVDLLIRITTEEIIWSAKEEAYRQNDPAHQSAAVKAIKAEKNSKTAGAVTKMSDFNMEGAIELAEKLEDQHLLVRLLSEHLTRLNLEGMSHPETAQKIAKRIDEVQQRAESYYDRFGSGWAFANFSQKVEHGELGSLLNEAQANNGEKQPYLTDFLKHATRAGQHIGKLSWINDVLGERDYTGAEQTLNAVAEEEEIDLWSKKTELSLAKLANFAAAESKGTDQEITAAFEKATLYDAKNALIDIQEKVTRHIHLMIGPTIDDKASEDLALSTFSARVIAKSPGLKRLFKSAIAGLINSQPLIPDELVDFLTLCDPVDYDTDNIDGADPGVIGQEFPLALRVVELAVLPAAHKVALRQLIWRRALIRDDWTFLNDTKGKSDEEVQEAQRQSTAYRTLQHVAFSSIEAVALDLSEPLNSKTAQAQITLDMATQIVGPSQILAENAFPVILQGRFEGLEKEKEAVRKDLEKEQATLKKYVDKAQLEVHWSGLFEMAKVEAGAEFAGEEEEEVVGTAG